MINPHAMTPAPEGETIFTTVGNLPAFDGPPVSIVRYDTRAYRVTYGYGHVDVTTVTDATKEALECLDHGDDGEENGDAHRIRLALAFMAETARLHETGLLKPSAYIRFLRRVTA
jgi:hypothetical protein